MEFYGIKRTEEYLEHSAKGTTWTKKNKKFLDKVKTKSGKWRYIYKTSTPRNSKPSYSVTPKVPKLSSTYSEYTDNDRDFDDANYSDKNMMGDTDFYGFQKPDGSFVILEEDMKWTIPAGSKVNKNEIIKRLEKFDRYIEKRRKSGNNISSDEWQRLATAAING